MSTIKQVKNEINGYLAMTHNKKSEAIRLSVIAVLAYILASSFLSPFDSSLQYDVRGEFCGYMVLLSFFCFLFIVHKHPKSHGIKLLSFVHVFVCLVNFLIIKSVVTPLIVKLIVLHVAIFLLLALLREIKNRAHS